MFIHTVYRPEENLDYIEDWLIHHTNIGVEHFYLYDNGGDGSDRLPAYYDFVVPDNYNKHGSPIKYRPEEARELQKNILSKFNVTIIPWQNRNSEGKLLYNQPESILHFSNIIKNGLCAFIDIDEFIIKKEEFKVCRMFQKKFKSRVFYNSVHDCHDFLDIVAPYWTPKVILDMANFSPFDPSKHDIHFRHLQLPVTQLYFNHYNHTKYDHEWLLRKNVKKLLLQNENDFIEPDFNKCFKYIEHTGLQK